MPIAYIGEPPEKRSIYIDIVNLPDPVKLGLTVRCFNPDDLGLYLQITGSGTGWTFGTVNLGLVASGADIYRNLDEFGSRAKPTVEVEETITLTLRAYTDAGYTDLRSTFNRTVTVVFIKSDHPSYTVDVLNNFDDGTVQGWAWADELNATNLWFTAYTDFVLSAPYALMARMRTTTGAGETRARIYKSFTTPDKPVVFAIFDVRLTTAVEEGAVSDGAYSKYLRKQRNATIMVHLGRPYDAVASNYVPKQKWMRIVVPLPRNTTLELRIIIDWYGSISGADARNALGLRMDDFKIISK